ncbi:MAG: ATP-grasp domain-containing protein [Methanomicrobiaceae archaeon]|nr:ATP-grasp domain-containing protein [Methanomicrobiaceae archaeon]
MPYHDTSAITAVIPEYGGRFAALAALRSLGRRQVPVTVVCGDGASPVFSSRYCTKPVVAPPVPDSFTAFGRNDVILPVEEDLMLALARSAPRLSCLMAFPGPDVLETALDKGRCMEHAERQGIASPATAAIRESGGWEGIERDFDYPVIVRPCRGTAGRGVVDVASPEMLASTCARVFDRFGPCIVQEKIPFSEKYTAGVLLNNDGHVRGECVLKEVRNHPYPSGQACCVVTVRHRKVAALAEEILQSLGFSGIGNVDCVIDRRTGQAVLLEVNPRFWGSMQAAITAGFDAPHLLVQLVRNGDVAPAGDCRTGVRCRNVIFNDARACAAVLRSRGSLFLKIQACADFLSLQRDDAWYVFDPHDPRPFFSMVAQYLQGNVGKDRRWDISRSN